MIDLDTREIDELEDSLKTFKMKAFPRATKETLNGVAFKARELAQENIRRSMTLRNKWTEKSIQVEMTRTLNVDRQESEMGSIEDYMRKQEEGDIETSKGKHGVTIPTGWSAGQKGMRPRTRLVKRANRLQNITLSKKFLPQKKSRRVPIIIAQAVSTGKRFVFLHLGKRKGIFKVVGGKKGNTKRAKIWMVHDLSHRSIRIPRNPWIEKAATGAAKNLDRIYKAALIRQLQKHRIFL